MLDKDIRFLVCTSPRVGATLLFSLLENAGFACKGAKERINHDNINKEKRIWEEKGLKENLKKIFDSTRIPNGVSGLKIHWNQLEFLVRTVKQSDKYLTTWNLGSYFPAELKYVHLTRRNKVRQAISLFKAEQTGVWSVRKGNKKDFPTNCSFDIERIDELVGKCRREENKWNHFFKKNGICPLKLEYEELTRDFSGCVVKTLEYLGLSVPKDLVIRTDVLKLSDNLSEDWVKKYDERDIKMKIYLYYKRLLRRIMEYIYIISDNFKRRFNFYNQFIIRLKERRLT